MSTDRPTPADLRELAAVAEVTVLTQTLIEPLEIGTRAREGSGKATSSSVLGLPRR